MIAVGVAFSVGFRNARIAKAHQNSTEGEAYECVAPQRKPKQWRGALVPAAAFNIPPSASSRRLVKHQVRRRWWWKDISAVRRRITAHPSDRPKTKSHPAQEAMTRPTLLFLHAAIRDHTLWKDQAGPVCLQVSPQRRRRPQLQGQMGCLYGEGNVGQGQQGAPDPPYHGGVMFEGSAALESLWSFDR